MQVKTMPCKGCKRPLRPKGMKKHEAPNTFTHRKDGYCDTCYSEKQLSEDGETMTPLTQEEKEAAERDKQALLDYFASRRPYREALGQKDFPDPFSVKAGPRKGASKTWRSRAKKPCGSEGAYQRHIKKNEDIDPACRAAHAVHAQKYRARKKLAS